MVKAAYSSGKPALGVGPGNVAAVIDEEIKRIIDECYEKCEKLLTDNRDKLDNVAKALVEYEKLDAAEFEKVFETGTLKEVTDTETE